MVWFSAVTFVPSRSPDAIPSLSDTAQGGVVSTDPARSRFLWGYPRPGVRLVGRQNTLIPMLRPSAAAKFRKSRARGCAGTTSNHTFVHAFWTRGSGLHPARRGPFSAMRHCSRRSFGHRPFGGETVRGIKSGLLRQLDLAKPPSTAVPTGSMVLTWLQRGIAWIVQILIFFRDFRQLNLLSFEHFWFNSANMG